MVPLSGWNPRNSSIFWSSASSSTDPVYFDTWSIAFGDPSAYEIFIRWKQKSFCVEEISRRNLHNSRYIAIWRRVIEIHGSNGVVRAKFRHNLSPESIGSILRVLLKLELLFMHHLKLKTPNSLLHIETLSILIFKFKESKRLQNNAQHSKKVVKLKSNKINMLNHKVWASYLLQILKSFGKNYTQVVVKSK